MINNNKEKELHITIKLMLLPKKNNSSTNNYNLKRIFLKKLMQGTEMEDIINQLKVDYDFCQEEDISIYKLYKDYCKRILDTTSKRTVSKKYFEKYISKIIPSEYIKDNQLLKEYWSEF